MYAEIIVNTNDIETATAVIPFMPVPIQIIMIGARAVLGKAFNTTKNGSIILAIILFHQRIIAISKPALSSLLFIASLQIKIFYFYMVANMFIYCFRNNISF